MQMPAATDVMDLDAKPAGEAALLDIRGLKTHFATDDGIVQAVDGVDLTVGRGETVCVVGESGCGKTVTALSVLKLIAMPPGRIAGGQILWQGRDIVPMPAGRDEPDSRPGNRHRVPGADDLAQSRSIPSATRSAR